eukprot:8647502-Pyramimonas_sp.AAC.1
MARTASQMPECWGAVRGRPPGGLRPEVFLRHVHDIACVPAATCMTRSINIFLDGPKGAQDAPSATAASVSPGHFGASLVPRPP